MTAKRKCSGTAYGICGSHPCHRSATVERDGDWYCWQHDPERVEGEKEKRLADWQAKSAREVARYASLARNARLAELVTPYLAELLERLGTSWKAGLKDKTDALAIAIEIKEALDEYQTA